MIERCGYCGYEGALIFVHSHYQCRHCGSNILPCCDGACADEDLSCAVVYSVSNDVKPETTELPSSATKEIQYSLFA